MKYYCKCGALIAFIKRRDLFSTFGKRTWLEGNILKIKCKKCNKVVEIELRKREDN